MEAKRILQEAERTEDDIWLLVRGTKAFKYFKEINLNRKNQIQQLHYQTCKVMRYVSFKPGEIIFKEGEPANDFYIVISGTVHIYQKKKFLQIEVDETLEKFHNLDEFQQKSHNIELIQKLKRTLASKSFTQVHLGIARLRMNKSYKDYQLETGELYPDQFVDLNYFFEQGVFTQNLIAKCTQGEAFGELGLILEQPRSATVLAVDEVELAQIDAQSYKMILQSAQVSSINKRLHFLYEHFLPFDTKSSLATQYAYDFKKVKFTKGRMIYKQNDPSDCFYLIYKGEVESVKVNENQSVKISRMGIGNLFGTLEYHTKGNREYTILTVSEKLTLFQLKFYQFAKMVSETPSLLTIFENHTLQKTQLLQDQIKRTMSVKFKTEQFERESQTLSTLQKQKKSKHFQSDKLLKKLVTQIDDYKKKGIVPTKNSVIKQQQQLQQSLMSIQESHSKMKQLIYKKAYLMPTDQENKLREQQKQSILMRSIFNDRDTSNVDRKEIVSYQLMRSHNKTQSRIEAQNSEISCFSKNDYSRNSSQSPSKKVIVSSKHNLFRAKPNKFFVFRQNYLSRAESNNKLEY